MECIVQPAVQERRGAERQRDRLEREEEAGIQGEKEISKRGGGREIKEKGKAERRKEERRSLLHKAASGSSTQDHTPQKRDSKAPEGF